MISEHQDHGRLIRLFEILHKIAERKVGNSHKRKVFRKPRRDFAVGYRDKRCKVVLHFALVSAVILHRHIENEHRTVTLILVKLDYLIVCGGIADILSDRLRIVKIVFEKHLVKSEI